MGKFGFITTKLLMVLLAVAALAGIGYYSQINSSYDLEEQNDENFAKLRDYVRRLLNNPKVIQLSVERNSNRFACLESGSSSCGSNAKKFLLFDSSKKDSAVISQIVDRHGLNHKFQGCTTFPSVDCPYRLTTKWFASDAGGGSCDSRHTINVSADLVFDDGQNEARTWDTENFHKVRVALSKQAACDCNGREYYAGTCQDFGALANRDDRREDEGRELSSDEEQRDLREEMVLKEDAVVICPPSVQIDDGYFAVNRSSNEAQLGTVEIPSQDGCGAMDIYRFQCIAKTGQERKLASKNDSGFWELDGEPDYASCAAEEQANEVDSNLVNEDGTYSEDRNINSVPAVLGGEQIDPNDPNENYYDETPEDFNPTDRR